jgi:hypothetical protein
MTMVTIAQPLRFSEFHTNIPVLQIINVVCNRTQFIQVDNQ